MNKYVESFQEFFGPLSNAQRAMFVVLMLVVLTIIGGVFYWSQQEENVLLFGSLQPEVAQEIVTELNNRGVNYELQESGRAIYVPSDKVHELRLELAPMGGSFSDVKGYELFDTNALGMTDFMQQVNKKRALEGELARSINSLEQVEFSRIHLVLPERSPFEEVSVEASASVILNLKKGQALKKEQIEGITSLIAGSVEGLESANVTVLDQAGNRLTDEIDYESELAFGSSQMQLRQKTEAYLTERGQSMLDRVLGAGNSILRVSVEHDFDRIVRESDLIDPDSRTVISEEKREQTNNDEVMEPVAGNVTNNNQTGSVVVASNNNGSTVQTRNYEVNRTREVFEKTQGELKMVSASVLLNYKQRFEEGEEGEQTLVSEPYSEQEVEEFKEVVKVALGIQDNRGDQLTVKQVEFFDKHPIDNGDFFTGQPTFTNNILRWSLIGITFVVVILLINSIKKKSGVDELNMVSKFEAGDQLEGGEKQNSLPGESSAANQLEGAEGAEGEEGENQTKKLPEKKYNKDEIVNFVELKPAEAAQVMRAMIASEDN
ncbi:MULTISPECIES: flagellar basal-body MS-ring/collar protein FliF [Gracilimonas]|uniref:Flagellar M-ring protein n=1 Tax=Gracilimonas sediminicola TaxID=2952158 RepID=A0A9X2RFS6_9BACT|nr:flagellar basal-body MS-ring/collar protein FliF [Gracilimonas sediminicola]MCP9291897.1 flagellar M-ring protein FliF [Gracilimonas sediminicola]